VASGRRIEKFLEVVKQHRLHAFPLALIKLPITAFFAQILLVLESHSLAPCKTRLSYRRIANSFAIDFQPLPMVRDGAIVDDPYVAC
jgi:hypothetical protein